MLFLRKEILFYYWFIVPPQIEEETFEPMNRIPEGGKAVVNCLASGSLPVITNWYRGGELVLEKQRGNMLEITDATNSFLLAVHD